MKLLFVLLIASVTAFPLEEILSDGKPLWYHPCKDVHINYDHAANIESMQGKWWSVASTLPVSSYHYNTNEIQRLIDSYVGCATADIEIGIAELRQLDITEQVRFHKNMSAADAQTFQELRLFKGDGAQVGANSLTVKYDAYPAYEGDNGHWYNVFKTENHTVVIDSWWVVTQPSAFVMTYTCFELPIAHNVTYKMDAWNIHSRAPKDLTPLEKWELEKLAKLHGIDSPDPLFHLRQNLCQH